MGETNKRPRRRASNALVAGICVACVAAMVGLAYASVPLYRLFCQVTGFGGTTQVADAAGDEVLERVVTIRFDANVSRDLAWTFAPVERQIEVKVGETALAFYRAANTTDERTVGTAVFNVTPLEAGQYFAKIDCFCFTEQALAPGQEVDMPVSFFVDPAIDEDPDLRRVTTITLSYTFFPLEEDEDEDAEPSAAPGGGA